MHLFQPIPLCRHTTTTRLSFIFQTSSNFESTFTPLLPFIPVDPLYRYGTAVKNQTNKANHGVQLLNMMRNLAQSTDAAVNETPVVQYGKNHKLIVFLLERCRGPLHITVLDLSGRRLIRSLFIGVKAI